MEINKIIKEKRIERNLTQEQVATYLGVSTPAVNKWEKGNSYPDITILPSLARLLKVDLNTLFSFHEHLAKEEIWEFTNQLISRFEKLGYDEVFNLAMDKIHQYPTCDRLILHLAVSLMGGLHKYKVDDKEKYEEKITKLYEDCACSDDEVIKNQAIAMLISKYLHEENFDMAQSYIDKLPNETYDGKMHHQANLYAKSKEYNKALEIYEGKLMNDATEIHITLITMIEIALKENRNEDAKYFAEIAEKSTKLFELWEYNADAAYFYLYTEQKDAEKLLSTLEKMLPNVKIYWDISKTKLYNHIKVKEVNEDEENFFFTTFIEMLKSDAEENLDFIKDHPRFISLLEKYSV